MWTYRKNLGLGVTSLSPAPSSSSQSLLSSHSTFTYELDLYDRHHSAVWTPESIWAAVSPARSRGRVKGA